MFSISRNRRLQASQYYGLPHSDRSAGVVSSDSRHPAEEEDPNEPDDETAAVSAAAIAAAAAAAAGSTATSAHAALTEPVLALSVPPRPAARADCRPEPVLCVTPKARRAGEGAGRECRGLLVGFVGTVSLAKFPLPAYPAGPDTLAAAGAEWDVDLPHPLTACVADTTAAMVGIPCVWLYLIPHHNMPWLIPDLAMVDFPVAVRGGKRRACARGVNGGHV